MSAPHSVSDLGTVPALLSHVVWDPRLIFFKKNPYRILRASKFGEIIFQRQFKINIHSGW